MEKDELSKLAAEIARIVIENGRVDGEGEWWLLSLGAEIAIIDDVTMFLISSYNRR